MKKLNHEFRPVLKSLNTRRFIRYGTENNSLEKSLRVCCQQSQLRRAMV